MDLLTGLGPFVILVLVAFLLIWRGLRQDIHDKDTGGGDDGSDGD